MKVLFKYSKSLGKRQKDEEVEMHSTTAAILQRKGFGKISKKLVSLKNKSGQIKAEWAALTDEDKESLKLSQSLVKK